MSEVKIPGLIAKENESNSPTQSQVDKFQELIKNYVSDAAFDLTKQAQKYQENLGGYVGGSTTGSIGLVNDPLKKYTRANQVLGGPTTRRPSTYQDYEDMFKVVKEQQKSQFESLLDILFTVDEKIAFLSSLGYESTMQPVNIKIGEPVWKPLYKEDGSYAYTGSYDTIDSAFLKEITIKFKNLLLAKSTLKLKL